MSSSVRVRELNSVHISFRSWLQLILCTHVWRSRWFHVAQVGIARYIKLSVCCKGTCAFRGYSLCRFWKTNQNQTGPLITAPATGEITGPQMVSRRTKTQQNMYKRSNRRAVILKSFWSWWFTVDVNRAVPHSPALVENQKTSLWTFTACLYFILPLTLGREISCPEQMLHLDCPDR